MLKAARKFDYNVIIVVAASAKARQGLRNDGAASFFFSVTLCVFHVSVIQQKSSFPHAAFQL